MSTRRYPKSSVAARRIRAIRFGAQVGLLRRQRAMSVAAVAHAANVSPSTIRRIEDGSTNWRMKTFASVLYALGYEMTLVTARRSNV